MMKKTLLAMAVAALAAPTWAADSNVTVYGLIDVGMSFVHSDADSARDSTNKFSMENAQEFGSRWGLRGTEQLGNGLSVGFTLESGFESDTGSLDSKQGGRLFGREASVNVSGNFGTVWAGRLPIFGSVLGPNGLFRAIDPINANYTVAFGSRHATASLMTRVDNALAYRTPTVGGFTGYAMYSFKSDATKAGDEGKSSAERYGSLALQFKQSALELVAIADTTNWSNTTAKGEDDGFTFTLGGNYTFDNGLKVLAFGQYFDNQFLPDVQAGVVYDGLRDLQASVLKEQKAQYSYGYLEGWGASIGVNYPMLGGVAKASFNYRDMDNQAGTDFTRWTVAAAYDYPLSKRTAVYVMGGYTREKIETDVKSATPSGYQLSTGIVHRF